MAHITHESINEISLTSMIAGHHYPPKHANSASNLRGVITIIFNSSWNRLETLGTLLRGCVGSKYVILKPLFPLTALGVSV